MTMNPNAAKTEYEAAVKDLEKFCEDQTDLCAYILDDEYPIRVQFVPSAQMPLLSDGNVDENGEVNDLTVTVGLSSAVRSTLKFNMDSKLLKKLIKLAEKVGTLYYQAFREQEGARTTAQRPEYEADGYADGYLVYDTAYCPECRHSFEEGINDWGSSFCPDCGQKLDWTQEADPGEEEEQHDAN